MTVSRRPTIGDVARAAGASTATVSRVLTGRGRVSAELTARVLATVDRLGYSPNGLTRSIFQGWSNCIGVLIGDLRSPFYLGLIRGVEEVATPADHLPLFANTARDTGVERRLLRLLEEQRVRGVVVTTGPDTDDITRKMAGAGTRCVLVTRRLNPPCPGVHSIRLDDRAAGELACRHLYDNGRQRVAVITSSLKLPTQRDRLAGIRDAMVANGHQPVPTLVAEIAHLTAEDARPPVLDLIERSRDRRGRLGFDAVIVTSGLKTHGVFRALRELGLRVPDDVAFVGFDDFPWAPYLDSPLTLVDQPAHAMGRQAAELILADPPLTEPVDLIVEPRLMARRSSDPPATGPGADPSR
jgi:LacI family transcriptional regulator